MVTLNHETHTYTNFVGVEYTPVSTVLDKVVPEFKSEDILPFASKHSTLSADEMAEMWNMKGDIGRAYGNAIDMTVDMYVKYGEIPKHPHMKKVIEEFKKIFPTTENLTTQFIVYDDNLLIAGTPDVIDMVSENKAIIWDVKTTIDLRESKGYFLEPYNTIRNSAKNKFRLQLSLYKRLLETMKDVEVIELNILLWDGETFEIIGLRKIDIESLLEK